jgi:hypothetical protein
MLEYTKAREHVDLAMLVLHGAPPQYAHDPARALPDARVGTFTQALYDEAIKQGCVISMKKDWKRIFASES